MTKFLGMWLDQNVNWVEHISRLKTKIKRNLDMFHIGKHYLNCHTKKYHIMLRFIATLAMDLPYGET